jgi:hypothetical protein
MGRKNPAAVALGKLRAQKGPPLSEAGRLGGAARAENLSASELAAIAKKAGLKGGSARAKKLSPERRSEIAKKAAEARWRKKER